MKKFVLQLFQNEITTLQFILTKAEERIASGKYNNESNRKLVIRCQNKIERAKRYQSLFLAKVKS